jgi:hypothetical protein
MLTPPFCPIFIIILCKLSSRFLVINDIWGNRRCNQQFITIEWSERRFIILKGDTNQEGLHRLYSTRIWFINRKVHLIVDSRLNKYDQYEKEIVEKYKSEKIHWPIRVIVFLNKNFIPTNYLILSDYLHINEIFFKFLLFVSQYQFLVESFIQNN